MQQTETSPATAPSRRWASIKGAAEHVGVTPRTIHQLIEDGHVPAYRLGPKTVRVDLNELDRVALQPYNKETSMRDGAEVADEHKRAVRCLMQHDHVGMAQVINRSRYPHKVHLAAALNVIARMVSESPDPERLLEAIGEIVARD